MLIDIAQGDLKRGLLGLVIALVEIIKEALKLEAVRRMEGGSLTMEEVERLGEALSDLEVALEELKMEQGLAQSVKTVRDGLDRVVDELVERFSDPRQWLEDKLEPARPSGGA